MEQLWDISCRALRHAESMPNITYCDSRAETHNIFTAHVENGKVDHIKNTTDSGIGIRMLDAINGAWQFVSKSNPQSLSDVKNALKDVTGEKGSAASIIRHKKMHGLPNDDKNRHKINMYDVKQHTAKVKYPVRKTPDQDSVIKIGMECSKIISNMPHITNSTISVKYHTASKHYTNSQGADITQTHTDTTMYMSATASINGTTRSIDATVGGRGGLERIHGAAESKATYIGRTAPKVAAARPIKYAKDAQVIMNPSFVALLVHEIMGHPSEADRIMGREMAWAGGAWWSNMRGKKIASDALNVFDDPTIPDTLGHYRYDDEGVKSAGTTLIKEGVLHGHLQSRETAAHRFYDKATKPTANMRAASYEFVPLIRMACTCIKPGSYSTDEMIGSIKDGYIIHDMKVPSIDMHRYNWSMSCQYAQRIKNGEPADVQRDVIVSGTAPRMFESISACGKDFEITPITNCGKGDPMQLLVMGNGGPSIKARATLSSI